MSNSYIYKITLSYRGTDHYGWQVQPKHQTLQQELNSALEKITKGEAISSLASGRTDTGVHAIGQVVRVTIPFYIEPVALGKALNANLHPALRVRGVEVADESFHPIADSIAKEYRYFFTKSGQSSFFLPGEISIFDYDFDLELMNRAAQLFVGEHDFFNFHTLGSDPATTIRKVLEAEVFEIKGDSQLPWTVGEFYCFRVKGQGFLKQMVRSMMGAIWAVGRMRCDIMDLQKALERKSDQRVGAVAPPDGLYLWQVWYDTINVVQN